MKKVFAAVLVLVLCVSLCACGASESAAEAEAAQQAAQRFQEDMAAAMSSVDPAAVTGDKAVSIVFESRKDRVGVYGADLVPETIRTEDPGAVRYLIRCIKGSKEVGYYTGGTPAFRRTFTVEVEDLKQGQILNSKVFLGGEPPRVLEKGKNTNVGSDPDAAEIHEWVMEQITRGTSVDCEKSRVNIYVQVPEGWGDVYLGYIDKDYPEEGVSSRCVPMEREGEWYVLTIPGWAEKIYVCSDPRLLGEEGYHSTEAYRGERSKDPDAAGRDLWIRVLDMEKNVECFREKPAQ